MWQIGHVVMWSCGNVVATTDQRERKIETERQTDRGREGRGRLSILQYTTFISTQSRQTFLLRGLCWEEIHKQDFGVWLYYTNFIGWLMFRWRFYDGDFIWERFGPGPGPLSTLQNNIQYSTNNNTNNNNINNHITETEKL